MRTIIAISNPIKKEFFFSSDYYQKDMLSDTFKTNVHVIHHDQPFGASSFKEENTKIKEQYYSDYTEVINPDKRFRYYKL
jgi:hypothetical protein